MQRTFSPRTRLTSACALSLALACGFVGAALAQDDVRPVTLRLAIADDAARPTYPIVEAFVGAASELSDGAVTIQPIFDAARDFEIGTAKLLLDGTADLAIVAGRSWDQVGVDAFKALQTPFLIDDDALAEAVADSDAARAMLDSVAGDGLVGLELWPEDLRHPAAYPGCAEPLVSPGDFAGLDVRAAPSDVTYDLLGTLGAHPSFDDSERTSQDCSYQATESGLRQGRSLSDALGTTFTGDVTLFPKYQVLAANAAAFERLSDAQREVIRRAAAEAQDLAIDTHPTDAQAAAELCAAGHRVVLAGPEGVAAFQAAAQPVYERLAADPVAAQAIAAITALKDTLEPAPGARACDPDVAEVAPVEAATDPGPIPDGAYAVTLTNEDALRSGFPHECLMAGNESTVTVTLVMDGTSWTELQACSDGPPFVGSDGTLRYEGDRVILTSPGVPGYMAYVWQYDGTTLSLRLLEADPQYAPTEVLRFLFENDFMKSPDPTVAAIPDGSYSATRTKEDALRIGWWHDECVDLRDGRDMTVTLEVEGTDWVESNTCADGILDVGSHGTLRYEDDRVILTEPGLPGHPSMAYAWQYHGNVLSLRLLEVEPDHGETEVARVLFENDFTRAADE